MTQPSRTTESISRDNAAIREIMHRIRDLTVPDRATVALGVVGHLATLMNRSQMAKLMRELQEEAERVQDVPPSRQRDLPSETTEADADERGASARARGERDAAAGGGDRMRAESHGGVGQAGRGEFRSGELL